MYRAVRVPIRFGANVESEGGRRVLFGPVRWEGVGEREPMADTWRAAKPPNCAAFERDQLIPYEGSQKSSRSTHQSNTERDSWTLPPAQFSSQEPPPWVFPFRQQAGSATLDEGYRVDGMNDPPVMPQARRIGWQKS
ncbi:hypothetical protein V496_04632 [Pseudogymnoascus sp. VKM F-4515 (FW-2607)]|nr:hypothetical protein V496_04632 [Pseudogymnoascus sp. VKM F-4515 (FW-2607)]KFY76591.1 hypothetical protein V498_09552 [Pseudogymnoascus sp. VKM F-4517 (FW-2822)]